MVRLIDADALIADAKELMDEDELMDGVPTIIEDYCDAQPTIDAVPVVHGRWIYGNDFHWYTASCSKCGYRRSTDIKAKNWNGWVYCPMCGAKMDEVQE